MSKKNRNESMPEFDDQILADEQTGRKKKKKKKGSGAVGRFFRRFFLCFFTLIILILVAFCLVLNLVFNGPSESARVVLTMSLTEASATKWVPGLFMDDAIVEEIRKPAENNLIGEETDVSQIVINRDPVTSGDDEWANYPDGIRIFEEKGKTFNAHVMLIRDPSRVYMATSTPGEFSTSIPGTRINQQIETEGASAAINAGAFNDDGTANSYVGSIPAGLLMAQGELRSNAYHELVPNKKQGKGGFAGFTEDDILVVANTITPEEAEELKIRDGCEFGPVLIMNGVINEAAFGSNSGYNPRTAIGQRADGTVIFLCIDGRQAGSPGGTYKDVVDIMVKYEAVNACNMDGGSSSIMLYRDTQGLYGEPGQVQMINNYSLLQKEPRRMPNFWMVRPAE